MRANKYLLLVSSLLTLAVLAYAAHDEHDQEWRRLQEEYQRTLPADLAASFSVELRQVVVPNLRAADRCISCHVGMAPGEPGVAGHRVFVKHPNVTHDPAEIGCTVCHGG
jgi:hypothetical protein